MRQSRSFLAALTFVASAMVPAAASAQSTPPLDQPFVVASQLAMPVNTTTLVAALTPSLFGCTGSQMFYVRTLMVSANTLSGSSGGYWLTVNVAQRGSGAATGSPLVFPGPGGSGVLFTQTFALSSVGAPVTSIQLYKSGWGATFNIVAWGYCGNPTTIAPVTWKT
jgi:hypothetical protein